MAAGTVGAVTTPTRAVVGDDTPQLWPQAEVVSRVVLTRKHHGDSVKVFSVSPALVSGWERRLDCGSATKREGAPKLLVIPAFWLSVFLGDVDIECLRESSQDKVGAVSSQPT